MSLPELALAALAFGDSSNAVMVAAAILGGGVSGAPRVARRAAAD
jgi:hypothetical protein